MFIDIAADFCRPLLPLVPAELRPVGLPAALGLEVHVPVLVAPALQSLRLALAVWRWSTSSAVFGEGDLLGPGQG